MLWQEEYSTSRYAGIPSWTTLFSDPKPLHWDRVSCRTKSASHCAMDLAPEPTHVWDQSSSLQPTASRKHQADKCWGFVGQLRKQAFDFPLKGHGACTNPQVLSLHTSKGLDLSWPELVGACFSCAYYHLTFRWWLLHLSRLTWNHHYNQSLTKLRVSLGSGQSLCWVMGQGPFPGGGQGRESLPAQLWPQGCSRHLVSPPYL